MGPVVHQVGPEERFQRDVLVRDLPEDPRGEEMRAELSSQDAQVLASEQEPQVVVLGEGGHEPVDQHLS